MSCKWCGRGFQVGLKWCGRRSQVSLEWVTEGSRWLRFCGGFFASSGGGKDSSLPGLVAGVAGCGFFFFFFFFGGSDLHGCGFGWSVLGGSNL